MKLSFQDTSPNIIITMSLETTTAVAEIIVEMLAEMIVIIVLLLGEYF